MDLDALFILLQPWLRPFLAFVFFTFLRRRPAERF